MPKRPRLKRAQQSSAEQALKRAGLVARVSVPDLRNTGASFYGNDSHAAEEEARRWYAAHDRDGNGVLDHDEYRELLRSVGSRGAGGDGGDGQGLHPHYIDHFLKLSDANSDGFVTLEEFMRVYEGLRHFDRLLNAPRRRHPTAGDHPAEVSRLKEHAELVCPEYPSRSIALEGGPHGEFTVEARFDQLTPIGHGAYGAICSAIEVETGETVAIKKVRPTDDVLQLRCCLRELTILRHLGEHEHPNLLGLREVLHPPGGPLSDWRDLYLVTDLYQADLHSVLRSDQPLAEGHVQFFVWQLLRGVHALHSAGVVHRDLKPSNLLVNGDCELRIADFGISRGCPPAGGAPEDLSLLGTSYVVTRWYRCPELLCGNRRYSCVVDLWSCGCILAEILGRAPLFASEDHMKMLREIVALLGPPSEGELAGIEDPRAVGFLRRIEGGGAGVSETLQELFPDASEGSLELLQALLCFDPKARPSAAAALGHPWLESLHEADDLQPLPPVDFTFESCDLNLDHFLLCALDALTETDSDYPLSVPQMLRFGIMQAHSTATPSLWHAQPPHNLRLT